MDIISKKQNIFFVENYCMQGRNSYITVIHNETAIRKALF